MLCMYSYELFAEACCLAGLIEKEFARKTVYFKGQVFWLVFGLCVTSLMNEVQGIMTEGKGVSETTQFCITSFMNGPLRSAGPGGFSPFFSWGGIKLLCSQEFIWEMEFTQFIRDLWNKTKRIEGSGPHKKYNI